MFLRAGVLSALFALALVGQAFAADASVTATPSDTFTPAAVTVNVGESVTWTNSGGSHNVVFDDGSFTDPLGAVGPGADWPVSRTFTTPGAFRYYCVLHGDPGGVGMSGTVTVVAPGTPPPSGPPQNTPPTGNPPSNGPGSPAKKKPLFVSFKASDVTPLAGKRIRLSGVVKPARDGRKVLVQKRLRSGKYRTIATARLKHAAGGKSTFSVRVRVSATATLRVKIAGDGERATGLSKARKIRVQRP